MSQRIESADVVNLYQRQLSRDVRMQAQTLQRFRQFVRPEANYGAHMGEEIQFTKITNLRDRGRAINENEAVPVSKFDTSYYRIGWREHSNSVQISQRASLISELCVGSMAFETLKNDAAQTLDIVAAQPFINSPSVYTPMGTYGAKSAVINHFSTPSLATRPFQMYDLRRLVNYMKDIKVPTWNGTEKYICIASRAALSGLFEDPEFIEQAKYAAPDRLFKGEVGDVYGVKFIEEGNVLNTIPGGGGEMVFFGDDAVTELEVYPLELQIRESEDYGRTRAVRWVWMGGFGAPWNFVQDQTTRIIRVGSSS